MKKLLLSAVISASVAQPAAALDLTGMWNLSAGIQVAITQKPDNTFEGMCFYPAAVITALGNVAINGEKCVYGTVDHAKLTATGKVLVFDTLSYKEKCPTQTSQWVDLMIGYQAYANALVGIRKVLIVKDDCSLDDTSSKTITYAAPNHCIANYVTMAGEAGDLKIPCLNVRVVSSSGEQTTSNYNVDLKQQKPTAFTFDLNLESVQPLENFQINR